MFVRTISVIFSVSLLSGCMSHFNSYVSAVGDIYNVSSVVQQPPPKDDGLPKPIDLDTFKFKGSNELAYIEASKAESSRNRLQSILLTQSDTACRMIKAQIAGVNDTLNFSLGGMTTLLGGAGAIVTGETAARTLSGLAGITNATRTQVNELFFQNALKTAIISAITRAQDTAAATLQANRQKNIGDYSVDDMVRDVEAYNGLCCFWSGVALLQRASDTVVQNNVSSEQDFRRSQISTNNGATPTPLESGNNASEQSKETQKKAAKKSQAGNPVETRRITTPVPKGKSQPAASAN